MIRAADQKPKKKKKKGTDRCFFLARASAIFLIGREFTSLK
jgi:hypothetical protein